METGFFHLSVYRVLELEASWLLGSQCSSATARTFGVGEEHNMSIYNISNCHL